MIQYQPENKEIRLRVVSLKTDLGKEPIRECLKSLSLAEKRVLDEDIKTVQFGWPLGMPIVRKLEPGIWEVRSKLPDRHARVLFTVKGDLMVLIHGFIKKSEKPRWTIGTWHV